MTMSRKNIEFINLFPYDVDRPYPAKNGIPKWYKDIASYGYGNKKIPRLDSDTVATVKKCVPVFDAITSGYLIITPCDLYVHQVDGLPFIQWPSTFDAVSSHPIEQIEGHPVLNTQPKNTMLLLKMINMWMVKTPPGYSCIFLPPMHRDNLINIIPAIVDTDKFDRSVEFPFVLSDPSFTGLIPKGTEIAQVIPFKRDSWKSTFSINTKLKNESYFKLKTTFFDFYRNVFWSKKDFS